MSNYPWHYESNDDVLTEYSDPGERPTADTLLRAPFCIFDPHYAFLDTELYAKIRGAF